MIRKIKDIVSEKITSFYWKNHRSISIRHKNDEGIERFAELYGKPTGIEKAVQGKAEALFLYTLARKLRKIDGCYAEGGVFKGFGARFICETKGDKELHLFDTFAGFPQEIGEFDTTLGEGVFLGRAIPKLETVKSLLSSYPNVFFHKGIFSDTCKEVSDKRFALVHLDFDMYKPTKHAIEFFYPRMNPGGVMIFHDYRFFAGVKKAVNEFFEDKKEVVFCWNENQGIAFKTGVGKET